MIFKAIAGALKDPLTQIVWDFEGNGKVGAEGERAEVVVRAREGVQREPRRAGPGGPAPLDHRRSAGRHRRRARRDDGRLRRRRLRPLGRSFPDLTPGLPLRYSDIFFGPGIHPDVVRQGKKPPARLRFQPTMPRAGRYQVCLGFRPGKKQATNVPILIRHAGGNARLTVNEREETTPFALVPIGEFRFNAGDAGFVEITNGGTDGLVMADGVRWVWLGE